MDNDVPAVETASSTLPRTTPFESVDRPGTDFASATDAAPVAAQESADRAGVFQHLVTDDGDIAGLVAYSIYKQNKLDWLQAFQAAKGRAPNEGELASYIIGEGTPRRLATYRHLAEATLSGNGPNVGDAQGPGLAASRRRPAAYSGRTYLSPALVGLYVLIAAVLVVGVWLAVHFTLTSH